ncbi:MAG: hypothetical protein FWF97_01855 [Alphaproteobacteria bacterium]|nr:hypothetical protein [Alphaproteobacteria bacterium]
MKFNPTQQQIVENMTPFNIALCYKLRDIKITGAKWESCAEVYFTIDGVNFFERHAELLKQYGLYNISMEVIEFDGDKVKRCGFSIHYYKKPELEYKVRMLEVLLYRFRAIKVLTGLGGLKINPDEAEFFPAMYTPGAGFNPGFPAEFAKRERTPSK